MDAGCVSFVIAKKANLKYSVASDIDRNNFPLGPSPTLFLRNCVAQFAYFFSSVLPHRRDARELDAVRVAELKGPVSEMEEVARHRYGL
jgi:hypothetical protein